MSSTPGCVNVLAKMEINEDKSEYESRLGFNLRTRSIKRWQEVGYIMHAVGPQSTAQAKAGGAGGILMKIFKWDKNEGNWPFVGRIRFGTTDDSVYLDYQALQNSLSQYFMFPSKLFSSLNNIFSAENFSFFNQNKFHFPKLLCSWLAES